MVKYCEECGSVMAELFLPTEDRIRLVCAECGHIAYVNPRIVSGTLPIIEGKVYLLRRGIEPRVNYWTYPAGYQEIDETTEEAARRETLEEIGLDVVTTGLFGVYSRAGNHVVNVVYMARPLNQSARPILSREALEVQQFSPNEVPWDELAFPSTTQVMRDWVRLEHEQAQ